MCRSRTKIYVCVGILCKKEICQTISDLHIFPVKMIYIYVLMEAVSNVNYTALLLKLNFINLSTKTLGDKSRNNGE